MRSAHIKIGGSLDELLPRILPHEVTHIVLMYHFRRPIPRWADEGAAILSENASKLAEHDRRIAQILRTPCKAYTLHFLFNTDDYPRDWKRFIRRVTRSRVSSWNKRAARRFSPSSPTA